MRNRFIDSNKKVKIVWRILGVWLVFFASSILAIFPTSFLFQGFEVSRLSEMITNTMNLPAGNALASLLGAILLFLFFILVLSKEKISFREIGFVKKNVLSSLILGLFAGIVFILFMTGTLYLSKQYILITTPLTQTGLNALLWGLLLFIGVAFSEEIVYRGYIQHALKHLGLVKSICITSLLFAITHLINSSYSPLSLIYLVLGGILFSLIRVVAKNIWVPIGFHITWNWTLSSVLGILYENPAKRWLFTYIPQNTIWNGGQNGPESGLVGIIMLLIAIVILIIVLIKKKGVFA